MSIGLFHITSSRLLQEWNDTERDSIPSSWAIGGTRKGKALSMLLDSLGRQLYQKEKWSSKEEEEEED